MEFLEIGELSLEACRALLRLAYHGDASITLQLQLQSNPLSLISAREASYISPIELTVSQVHLDTLLSVHVSRWHGVTVTFRNDPIQSLQINTTFDGLPAVQAKIQEEVERRVREALRTELPAAIHEMTKEIFENMRRDSITEGIDQLDQRPTTASAQEGPVRVRCGPRPVPEYEPSQQYAALRRDTFDTLSQHSIRSAFSRFSTLSYSSRNIGKLGSSMGAQPQAIPMAKRMEILRARYSSLSPIDSINGTVVHQAGISKQPSRPSSPNFHSSVD